MLPVPGRASLIRLNGTVIADQSVLAGVRLTGARLKAARSEGVIASTVAGGTMVVGLGVQALEPGVLGDRIVAATAPPAPR